MTFNTCNTIFNIFLFPQDAPGRTSLTTVPSNRTLPRGSIVSLNCGTDASPKAEYYFLNYGTSVGNSSSGVLNVTVEEDGVYTCVPINTVGKGDNATVSITAVGEFTLDFKGTDHEHNSRSFKYILSVR